MVRGMPGPAMFPLGHLGEPERKELVAHVRRLIRDGVEDRLRREAKEFGEEVVPEKLANDRRLADAHPPGLSPSKSPAICRFPLPSQWHAAASCILEQCATCHGNSGKGDGVQEQHDESGVPIRPRDFTRGVFKGGREREQLYARIILGVPGTPMPASPNFKPAEVGDLISYIQSLSDASTPAKVEHHRAAHRPPASHRDNPARGDSRRAMGHSDIKSDSRQPALVARFRGPRPPRTGSA